MKINKILMIIITFLCLLLIFSNLSLASSDIIVALDPGHGGNDPGAMGGNLKESDLTWKIASRVKEILDETPGITGVLTKSQYESLGGENDRKIRAERAVANNADLLVSFHINSNASSNSMSGAEVYITGYTAEKRFYEYSNRLGLDILSNLRSVGVQSHSTKPIVRTGADWDRYPDGSVADYYGIISWPVHMGIPGMIIEHAFINNPYDRENYLNDTMLNKMAEADAQAIIKNKELFRREYVGDINTDLQTMKIGQEADGRYYITGNVLIAEWIDGVARVPNDVPEITIKSTDGSFSTGVALTHNEGLNYTYYRIIDNLDVNKEYYLEAALTSEKNVSQNKTQRVNMQNLTVGEFKGTTVKTKNNTLYFSKGEYVGDINTDLKEIKLENSKIKGNILIAEYINNVANTPNKLPAIELKAKDNSEVIPINIEHISGLEYNFNFDVAEINSSKQYYLQASLKNLDNIGTNKVQHVLLPEQELGEYNGRTLITENNLIKPTYIGEINTDLKTMKLELNGSNLEYITGEILIAEWIDGEACVPQGVPKMTIRATDGSYEAGFHIVHNGGLSYTYDRVVYNLKPDKEYEIEVELIGDNNRGTKKTQIVKLVDGEIGKIDTFKLIAEDNKIKVIDGSLYNGEINTDLKTMRIEGNKIEGEILIAEWIEGVANEPQGEPKMRIKSTEGTYEKEIEVEHRSGLDYGYKVDITGIDTSKTYYIEAELTGEKNIGNKKVQKANLNVGSEVGEYRGKTVVVTRNEITFRGEEYKGEINTDLKTMKLELNSSGVEYISGEILIAEWIDGVAYEPKGMPEMIIRATDGSYSAGFYLENRGGISYYYDRVVYNLKEGKEYEIEVRLTNENNISDKKNQKVKIKDGTIGQIGEFKLVAENNKIRVEDGSLYNGEINTDLKTMRIEGNKIEGEILIAEWIEGVANEPQGEPKMTVKSTDGEYSKEVKLIHNSGLDYSYNVDIAGIDTSKRYYIEVELTGEKNIGNKKVQKANLNAESKVGEFKETILKLENNTIIFEPIEKLKVIEEPIVEEKKEETQEENKVEEETTKDEVENKKEKNETTENTVKATNLVGNITTNGNIIE